MPLSHSLQGAPPWLNDYIQEIANRSRQLGNERHLPFRKASPEQNEAIKGEINRLVESQKGGKFDIISFSITGTSKPININPDDLRHIVEDEGFARRVYESSTGFQNVSRDELEDLRQRARQKFESSLPEIRKLEQEGRPKEEDVHPLEENIHRLELEVRPLKERMSRLKAEKSFIEKKLNDFNDRERKIIEGRNSSPAPGVNQYIHDLYTKGPGSEKLLENIRANRAKVESEAAEKFSEISDLDMKLGQISNEKSKFESQLGINPLDLPGRASLERKINRLQSQNGLIAPMNQYHERAINLEERGLNDDTMQLSGEELREAKRHNELRAVEPLVKSSLEGPSDEYMNKYVNDYTKDIRKALEDESEEEFIKKIAPKINMSFAQMGAFHSGARAKALKDTLLEHRTKLHREVAHLTGSARDKAMEHHELQKRREQSAAHLMGHTTKSQQESSRHHAEALRQHGVTKHSLNQLNVAALGQIAKAKQEQEQHQIDVERQEYERELLHPHEKLARESALVSGLPSPPIQSISGQATPYPAPPNLFTLGAGTLASLAGGFGGQQQRQFKKGGSVRKKYADGGAVGQDDIGNEIRKIIQQQEQSGQERLNAASEHNPFQSLMRHVGREMLTNPSEDPLLSIGRGAASSMDHRDAMSERAANLYEKIQATKLNQYQVLAAYENMKEKTGLQRQALLEKTNFHNQQINALKNKNMNQGNISSPVDVGGQEFMPITSKREKEDILKDKKSSESILHELESIRKLSKEYEQYNEHLLVSPRTPLIGDIASGIQGRFSNITQNKNMRKAAVAKAALDSKLEKFKINMETKMRKGVLPEGMRNFMEKKEVFPSSHEPLDIYNKKLEDLLDETKNVYDASKTSLKYNVHVSPYDLERMKGEPEEELPEEDIVPSYSNENSWYEQLGGIPAE